MLVAQARPVRLSGARWMPSAQARLAQVSSETTEIEQAVDVIAIELVALSEKLGGDLDLALDADRFREVPVVGATLSQTDVLKAISRVAARLEAIRLKVLQPPLGPYVTPASAALLSTMETTLKELRGRMPMLTQEALDPAANSLAEDYSDTYLVDVGETIQAAEKLMVAKENERVPLYEEDEKNAGYGFWKVAVVGGVLVGLVALGHYSAKQEQELK